MDTALGDARKPWQALVAPYRAHSDVRSVFELATTVVPLAVCVAAMAWSLSFSYVLTLLLALPTAGMFVRLFIVLHDCGHGSFFRSRLANDVVGSICGVLLLTPYRSWRTEHSIHHANSGNLARRGVGEISVLTTDEYRALPRWQRLAYRAFRHPLVLFGIGPAFFFLVMHRIPPRLMRTDGPFASDVSVHLTTLASALLAALAVWVMGLQAFLLILMPVFVVATSGGVWLFYVQHTFDGGYWKTAGAWDFADAALFGASFYELPAVLRWFTGSIGYHHVHHLAPRVPSYHLQRCHDDNAFFHGATRVSLRGSLATVRLKLWDATRNRLVGFDELA